MAKQKNLTANDTWFFGHPKGMVTLFFTEMWERMSYYGMRALLVLYMTASLTEVIGPGGLSVPNWNPGLGLTGVEAQAIYGIYVGMVYFMVIPGGWLADNVFGHQKAVLIGAIIIALGHITLALPLTETFFLGLVFVVLGTGLLKGNISTIVGRLYKDGDERIQAGYTIFYMSINIGSALGFLIVAYLGEKIGWHWGFGAAGVGMIFGVMQYIYFRRLLGGAANEPNAMAESQRNTYIKWSKITAALMVVVIGLGLFGIISFEPKVFAEYFTVFLTIVAFVYFTYLFVFAGLTKVEKRNLFLLLVLFVGAVAFWSGFDQSGSSLSLFAKDFTDLNVLGYIIPIGWLQLANPIFVVIFAPIFAGMWMQLGRMNLDPSLPIKFAIGLFFMALSFVVMIYAVQLAMEVTTVGIQWLLITYLLQTWGELALSPIGLSAFSKYAPKKYIGQMFGLWFLASAIGGVLSGLLGGDALVDGLESISPVFEFMIEYYVLLGIILIAVGALFTFFDSYSDLQDKVKKLEKRISTLLKSN